MKFKSINFTCKNCGAPLRFSPISKNLHCEFCSTEENIENSINEIKEYDLKEALRSLEEQNTQEINKEITCSKCAASFTMTPYSLSANCPYCNTPVITNFVKSITPKSLLPFQLSEKEARERFKKWIGSLWFAPSELKKYLRGDERLKGYYLPHWTYDAQTTTEYQGQRGTIYYVTVERDVIIEGRRVRQQVQEARIRWRPVSGYVQDSFDDITVGASKTISRTILENLTPWNTKSLVPFNEKYLAGFNAEEYTIGLDNGYELAKIKMNQIIEQHVRHDIGGDRQQIIALSTNYHHTSYKNVLFPVWTAQFKWKNKTYNYAINGQTGKITGERPYSWVKIALLVGGLGSTLGGAVYLDQHPQIVTESKESLVKVFSFTLH